MFELFYQLTTTSTMFIYLFAYLLIYVVIYLFM